jgi:sporulation protein YlmC with PRC-barrel domain
MDARELKGMAVVTIAEAARVGRVENVLLETTPLRARGLGLATETGARVIGLADIQSVSPDAIVAADIEAARTSDAMLTDHGLMGLDELSRLKVVDQQGQYVGRIEAVDVDATTGDVAKVEIRKGDTLGIGGETTTILANDIVAIGEDLVTVRRQTQRSAST